MINGAERVIVSQLVRSRAFIMPSAMIRLGNSCFPVPLSRTGAHGWNMKRIPMIFFYVRVDRTRKVPITVLIRSLGIGTNQEIIDLFGEEPKILASMAKDTSDNYQDGLLELL